MVEDSSGDRYNSTQLILPESSESSDSETGRHLAAAHDMGFIHTLSLLAGLFQINKNHRQSTVIGRFFFRKWLILAKNNKIFGLNFLFSANVLKSEVCP